MKMSVRITLFFLICATAGGCASVQNASHHREGAVASLAPTPTASPVLQPVILKPVVPAIKLTRRQRTYLGESLPADVRKVLENAGSFEVFAEVDKDESSETDSRYFLPNTVVLIRNEQQKKEILEAFYLDAAREDSPAICYEPHHSLKATFAGKTVEIEICFDCSRFVVKNTNLWGTIVREDRRSEELITRIVRESGVKIER